MIKFRRQDIIITSAREHLQGILILAILVFSPLITISQQPVTDEYTLKAVYFKKFTLFTEWPDERSTSEKNTFKITILGKNPFGDILEKIYSTETIENKKVEIDYQNTITDTIETDILFISKSKQKDIENIIEILTGKPILIIGDTEGYAHKGVLINFYIEDRKVRFEINETAVKKAGFIMDFRLLSFARIVHPVK